MGGYHLIYGVYRAGIKQDMRAYLKDHKDLRLGDYLGFRQQNHAVQSDEFSWEETNREFSYRGKMYDVVNIRYTTDSIYICALRDNREDDLSDVLVTLRKNSQDHHSAAISMIKIFSVFTHTAPIITQIYSLPVSVPAFYAEKRIFPVRSEVQTPPPRYCI